MTVRIKNTADDRMKAHLHRQAPRLIQEPSLAGRRIKLGEIRTLTDEEYAHNKTFIDEWVKQGVVEVLDAPATPTVKSPTIEEWVAAGYLPENYPPSGFDEVPSPGLTAYRQQQQTASIGADVIKQALDLPSVTSEILPATPEELPEIAVPPVYTVTDPAPVGQFPPRVDLPVDRIDDTPPVSEPVPTTSSSTEKKGKKKLF
jgi:hypothetical protein